MKARRRFIGAGLVTAAALTVALVSTYVFRSTHSTPATAPTASRTPGVGRRAIHSRHTAAQSRRVKARRVTAVPILMYHVINRPPQGAPFPGLYVRAGAFAAQMRALAAAGYRGVTLNQVAENWASGIPLPAGRPIVISFDNGYRSQYTRALPILRRLGWRAVENLQLTGLPPSQGGLSTRETRGLVAAGWELDTQGFAHLDLPTLDAAQLRHEVLGARLAIRRRYHVAVRWFCYPSGHYDPTVVAAVRAAGYEGATTVDPGWASIGDDPYRLPRLRVLGTTTPAGLLALIAGTHENPPPPETYG